MEKMKKLTEYYGEECPKCGKIIIGTKESQVIYNLKIHMEAKHGKDKK